MSTPTIVKTSDINNEMNNPANPAETNDYVVSSTARISLSNNWVRNVANTQSGQINMGKLRWGINFGGRLMENMTTPFTGTSYIGRSNYQQNPNVRIETVYYALYSPGFPPISPTTSNSRISFFANGNMEYRANTTGGAIQSNVKTWLTTAATTNGNYTVQFQRSSGAVTGGSSATNTDLTMNATRFWDVGSRSTSGVDIDFARGNLIFKYDGTELIRRPLFLESSVQFEAVGL